MSSYGITTVDSIAKKYPDSVAARDVRNLKVFARIEFIIILIGLIAINVWAFYWQFNKCHFKDITLNVAQGVATGLLVGFGILIAAMVRDENRKFKNNPLSHDEARDKEALMGGHLRNDVHVFGNLNDNL